MTAKQKSPRPVKTPTVLQMEAVECGAASLAMILAYYRRYVPLEELRVECDVSRDGSKASNVLKAARRYGLKAKGFNKNMAAVTKLKPPFIVHWNFSHFLVVNGFAGDRVYLNDPAVGPRTVSLEEFDLSFTGITLVFEPGETFEPGGVRQSWLASLGRRLRPARTAIGFIMLIGLALVVPGLVVPTFTRFFVDEILIGGREEWIKGLLVGMGLTTLVVAGLNWLREYYLLRLETKLSLSTSSQFFWHVFHLPIRFFDQRYAGDIASRVAINDKVARLVAGDLATTVVSSLTVIFFAAVMFQYDALLTVIGISIILLNLAALRYFSRKRSDGNQRLLQERGQLTGVSMSGLMTIETIKASGTESDFFARWAGYHAKAVNAQQNLSIYSQILSNVPVLLTSLNTAAILGIGGWRVMQGNLSIGELVAFRALMDSFVSPFKDLVMLGSKFQEVEGDMKRLDDVLRHEVDPEAATGQAAARAGAARLEGHIELNNLTFGYSKLAPPLIKEFSLSIEPGQRVALVGGSGSGKSTVAKLVAGLYSPWSGEILLDGQPRSAWPRATINNSVAMVSQEIFLFDDTVRANITLWDPLIPDADVIQAAKDAAIAEVIAARPGSYDSLVGEGGSNFSGGQRQRLEIARALAINPSILILDEATSALDPATEQVIDSHVRRRGCTCLIVAHRLSTIRDCDEIIVLEQGQVVQRGVHDEMIDTDGPYARLIQAGMSEGEARAKSPVKKLLEAL